MQDIRHIGEDIILCSNEDFRSFPELLGRTRFLDELWLPCKLHELSDKQIIIINRFREERRQSDHQFKYADQSRNLIRSIISNIPFDSVMEVGCGKYPIVEGIRGFDNNKFIGIEIDQEAVIELRRRRFKCIDAKKDSSECYVGSYSVIVSLYAMHFNISDIMLKRIKSMCGNNSPFIFNYIAESDIGIQQNLAKVCRHWNSIKIIKTNLMSRKEFFAIGIDNYNDSLADKIVNFLEK